MEDFLSSSSEGCQHFVTEHVFLRIVGFRRCSGSGRGRPPHRACWGVPPFQGHGRLDVVKQPGKLRLAWVLPISARLIRCWPSTPTSLLKAWARLALAFSCLPKSAQQSVFVACVSSLSAPFWFSLFSAFWLCLQVAAVLFSVFGPFGEFPRGLCAALAGLLMGARFWSMQVVVWCFACV